MFTCFSIPTYASTENEEIKEQGNIELTDTVTVDEISENEIMTFPEMIAHYANSKGISYAEAINRLPDDIKERSMDRAVGYITRSVTLNVTSTYKPSIDFYCEVAYGGNFYNITSIYNVELIRNYGSISKQFKGTLKVWLRPSNGVEYSINGDFYNNGRTSVTANIGQITVGKVGTLDFSVTIESSHYKYFSEHKTKYFN